LDTVFQPIVDLNNNSVVGFEALTRPSNIFLERNKRKLLAVDLQALALSSDKAATMFPGNKVFINIRPATLVWLYKHNQKLYLPGQDTRTGDLVLELTESEQDPPMDVVKQSISWVQKILQCKIAIDDISSGYNRLRYAYELEPDYLKLDRPIIKFCDKGRKKQRMIQSLLALSESLNLQLIAEGIEREEERKTLVQLGVPLGQGYLFGKPSKDGR